MYTNTKYTVPMITIYAPKHIFVYLQQCIKLNKRFNKHITIFKAYV